MIKKLIIRKPLDIKGPRISTRIKKEDLLALQVYRTPQWVIDSLLAWKPSFFKTGMCLEPGSGDVRILRSITNLGNKEWHSGVEIRPTEMKKWVKKHKIYYSNIDLVLADFLKVVPRREFRTVVMNPPFTLTLDFINHAKKFLKPGGRIFVLQRLNFLGSKKRSQWFKSGSNLKSVLVIPGRPIWEIDGRPENSPDKDDYCWYYFKRGYYGKSNIDWLI